MIPCEKLAFSPLLGLSSRHLQTIVPAFRSPGNPPPTTQWLVNLENGDQLSCEVSAPHNYKKTVLLIHGLGGSQNSGYMIRISRQLYDHGYKVVRVNLRCCGTGFGLSKKPYYAGCSHDILHVLQQLDEKPIVIGFSLGGNVILKLAGELGNTAKHYVESFIAVCPTLDLSVTLKKIQQKRYFYYHSYYLKGLRNQSKGLLNKEVHSIYEFDRDFICPEWGFKSVEEYYQKTSSKRFIPDIQENTKILLTEDDPFISVAPLESLTIPKCVKVYTTTFGGHMGFIGHTEKEYQSFWLDQQIVDWVDNLKVEEVNNSGQ